MKTINKFIFLYLLLLTSHSALCQDTIYKIDGESIEAKIDIIDQETIKYKVYKNLNGPFYIIKKSDVASIKFENGTVENYKQSTISKKLNKSELQELIVKSVNEHGFEEDTFNRKYSASFEGDYLRLIVLKQNGKPTNEGLLYDFSNVYKFQKISNRSDKLAFINIFVSISENKKNTKWDKHKLIMRVDSPQNANNIELFKRLQFKLNK
ncbi:hypothetical protein [Flavobacterium facile]|uniref:hypothetical protein n=1 Tax=Flavobacterium facile TaxID=2893174 RepID=UPI002E776B0E|nr:hypothetical protein [Flavobacterium sp. T-12]